MAKQAARYFKLGMFVLGAIIALVFMLVLIGSGRFDRNQVMMETYFDESVQGLDIGSKVKYRGVTIGEVTRITFTSSKYELDKAPTERKQYVLVEAAIRSDLVGGKPFGLRERARLIEPHVERGLRVRLASQGLTGTSYLEVDFVDIKGAPEIAFDWTPDQLYVPSAPSTVTQVLSALDDVVTRIRKVDIESALNNFSSAMAAATRQLNALPVERLAGEGSSLLRDVNALVAELRRSNQKLVGTLDAVPIAKLGTDAAGLITELRQSNEGLRRFVDNPALARVPADISDAATQIRDTFVNLSNPELARTVVQLQRTVGRLERLLVGREGDLSTTLENLRVISDNLRDTTELARRYPSQLLLGGPPAPATGTSP